VTRFFNVRVRPLAALCAVLAVALTACSGGATPAPSPSGVTKQAIPFDGNWNWVQQPNKTELGVTHTQDSLNADEPDAARESGQAILSNNSAIWQNVHLMGFGTLNPEPAPGQFDWSSLDDRMQLVKDTNGKAMLTLCCSPDWMKGGPNGATDWDKLEKAPLPEHFQDFANLAAAAVQRYPQVQRVLVWNELKGFYNDDQNRWDYEGYTQLYNDVYKAIKAVRPDVQVGGPYAVITSMDPGQPNSSPLQGDWGVVDQRSLDIIDYWLANSVGADFIAVDGGTGTQQRTKPTSLDEGSQKFAAVDNWIQQRTKLPIWWAEYYPDVPDGADPGQSSPASAAADLAAVGAMARSGTAGALKWGPQGSDSLHYAALWTDSSEDGGGKPTPLTSSWQWLVPRLAKGNVEIGHSPTQSLLAFRAPDGALVVNTSGEPVTIGSDSIPAWGVALTDQQA
jgi:Glycosyl hydrolases family 39